MTLEARIAALATRIGNYLRDSVLPRLLPTGGTTGQVLQKLSNANFNAGWATPAGGGGGWTLIETIAPNGTSAALFDDIPTTYSDLLLLVKGVSHASGSNQGFRLEFSANNGVSFSPPTLFTVNAAASNIWYGGLMIPGYRLDVGTILGLASHLVTGDPDAAAPSASVNMAWRCTGGMNALRVTPGSATFDGAGSIQLYGR
jgi:hypothetical protein